VCWGAKDGVVAPAAVVFSSTDTVALPELATRRSGRPSPLTSPTATEKGPVPVAKVCWGAKDGMVAPAAVVFSSTDTVALPKLATRRSGRPSPLTSPTATELGALPVAKVCWGRKAALASGLDRTTPNVRFDWRIVLPMTGTAIVAVAWLGANRKVPLVAV